jgi:hypothetical protein
MCAAWHPLDFANVSISAVAPSQLAYNLTLLMRCPSFSAARPCPPQRSIIGVSRDLRGILAAAHNRPTYLQVFEAIFPRHVQTLISALSVRAAALSKAAACWSCVALQRSCSTVCGFSVCFAVVVSASAASKRPCLPLDSRFPPQTWWDTPAVTTSVLKCLDELCYNRGQRITFGSSSANGILLFREACSAVSGYGQRIASITPPPHEAYASKYKGIAVALSMFSRCLDGGYVNFGVFALYGDPALNNGFETALKLMLSLPQDDVMVRDAYALLYTVSHPPPVRNRRRYCSLLSAPPPVVFPLHLRSRIPSSA